MGGNDKDGKPPIKPLQFCFGHGAGAHVCGIAGLSKDRLEEMKKSTPFKSVNIILPIHSDNLNHNWAILETYPFSIRNIKERKLVHPERKTLCLPGS